VEGVAGLVRRRGGGREKKNLWGISTKLGSETVYGNTIKMCGLSFPIPTNGGLDKRGNTRPRALGLTGGAGMGLEGSCPEPVGTTKGQASTSQRKGSMRGEGLGTGL